MRGDTGGGSEFVETAELRPSQPRKPRPSLAGRWAAEGWTDTQGQSHAVSQLQGGDMAMLPTWIKLKLRPNPRPNTELPLQLPLT